MISNTFCVSGDWIVQLLLYSIIGNCKHLVLELLTFQKESVLEALFSSALPRSERYQQNIISITIGVSLFLSAVTLTVTTVDDLSGVKLTTMYGQCIFLSGRYNWTLFVIVLYRYF